MALTKGQQEASDKFKEFLLDPDPMHNEMVIAGDPGTGKTFLSKHLIEQARKLSAMQKLLGVKTNDIEIYCTATTNKAAEVLEQTLGEPAQTVHSLFGIRPRWCSYDKKNKLTKTIDNIMIGHSLVIIDECSGSDLVLQDMCRESTKYCKTLKIGDENQLCAVNANYAYEFHNPRLKVTLDEAKRFSNDSAIKDLNRQMVETIKTGIFKPVIPNGKDIIQLKDQAECLELVHKVFHKSLQNMNHAKIVCWGNPSVCNYNSYIRSLDIPDEAPIVGEVLVSNSTVSETVNLKPMVVLTTEQQVTVTDVSGLSKYYYYNNTDYIEGWYVTVATDSGYTYTVFQPRHMYLRNAAEKELRQQRHYYEANSMKDELADLRPLHASTAYKAQGSTYDIVIVDLTDIGKCHHWHTVARMLNVAFTRAKTKVYLYGKLPQKYQDGEHEQPIIQTLEKHKNAPKSGVQF